MCEVGGGGGERYLLWVCACGVMLQAIQSWTVPCYEATDSFLWLLVSSS